MASVAQTLISYLTLELANTRLSSPGRMLNLYHSLTSHSAPALRGILKRRLGRGKEDAARLPERMGVPGLPRPLGKLVWFHAASVGEAQSTLILIDALLTRFPDIHVLITTGTVSSAAIMQQRLPPRAIHQFYPLDHPDWVENFLNHWSPDLILWMESELWPNMLRGIRTRNIHCVLVNAHMSRRSYRRWKHVRETAAKLLSAFDLCLAQTEQDAGYYTRLRAVAVRVRDNVKYSADPLPFDPNALTALKSALHSRPVWLYASTHAGEEDMACRLHTELQKTFPNLLTIIAPRHPERREEILATCESHHLTACLRGPDLVAPSATDQIYIADTLGELGLFYRLVPLACIGRSFSNDGGGGHNPIEAAMLGCAVLHGPHVQNQQQIFAEMNQANAAQRLETEEEFLVTLRHLLKTPSDLTELQIRGSKFAQDKATVLVQIMKDLEPLLIDCGIMAENKP